MDWVQTMSHQHPFNTVATFVKGDDYQKIALLSVQCSPMKNCQKMGSQLLW